MYRGRCVVSSPLAPRAARDDLIARRDRQIKSKDAKSQMFEDAADLQAQLHTLPVHVPPVEALTPEHTNGPTPQCGQPMVRIGEDVSERLDVVPAEFFVHRHIRGKWVCKCCQRCTRRAPPWHRGRGRGRAARPWFVRGTHEPEHFDWCR